MWKELSSIPSVSVQTRELRTIPATMFVVLICLGSAQTLGQKETNTFETQIQPTFEQLEPDAVAFVQEHHPELVSLLQSLKAMRQKEYEMAIRDIVRTKKRLDALAKRESETHAIELDAWIAQLGGRELGEFFHKMFGDCSHNWSLSSAPTPVKPA